MIFSALLAVYQINCLKEGSAMDLIFLGTSAGAPTRNRNVSGTALIESSGKGWYLVDCGEATQHQLLRTPLTVKNLRGCFITHVHGDHCFGLPGLSLSVSRSCLPFELRLHASETLNGWRNGHVQVDTVALSHRVPSHGYIFAESSPDPRLDVQRLEAEGIPRGPIWGELAHGREVEHAGRLLRAQDYLRPARPGQRFIICGDNDTPELLAKVAPGADVLVHEATFCQTLIDRTRESYGHSSAAAVARFAESAGIPNLVLTHFSARYQSNPGQSPFIGDIREEAAASFTGQLVLARDLERYHLDRDGRLQVVMERMTQ
jgi:ribonuclease Z